MADNTVKFIYDATAPMYTEAEEKINQLKALVQEVKDLVGSIEVVVSVKTAPTSDS